MKYLIAGLGNPGPEYHATRHNAGFMVLDRMAAVAGLSFEQDRHGLTLNLKLKGKQLLLLKPGTFMNLSGKAVRYHLTQNDIPQSNLLVITDDLALPYGKIRLRAKGSAGGHNGLSNIGELLGNNDWARLRIGVGSNFNTGAQVDYVLSSFSADEQKELPALLDRSIEVVQAFCTIGVDRAMSLYNRG